MNADARSVPPYLLLLLLLGLLGMFSISAHAIVTTFKTPSKETAANRSSSRPASETEGVPSLQDAPPGMALTEEQAEDMTSLMRKLEANPNDADVLMEIGDIFFMAREWARAENFLGRAILSRPADTRPRFMLGMAMYQQGRMNEAAKTFEELLSIKEDPAALYNLAIIYKHHLNKDGKAKELLEKILQSPDADLDTQERARKEL